MPARDRLPRDLARLLAGCQPRAGSLAVTLFGDCIACQGGSVWLASLVEAMGAFGLNPRQLRTAMFRLVRDGWLSSEQVGRRSYYRFSDSGRRQFTRAAARIYASEPPSWDGHWTLVMPGGLAAGPRDDLRRRLGWLGFGALPNGLLAHPCADLAGLEATLAELAIDDEVVIWRAAALHDEQLRALSGQAWALDELAARFDAFITAFAPFERLLRGRAALDDANAFVLRILLVHEYRRILLGSAVLPPALLPRAWPGQTAMELVGELYARLHLPASRHASSVLSNADGALPPPDDSFYARFGGLPAPRAAVA